MIQANTEMRRVDPGVEGLTQTLEELIHRLETLTSGAESLAPALRVAPDALAMITDSADEMYSRAAASGVDLDARFHDLLRLAEKLTEPRTLAVFSTLLDRLDQLERLLLIIDQVPGLIALFVDSADELAARAQGAGVDFERGIARGVGAALRFGAMLGPDQLDAMEALLHDGILDPPTLRLVGSLGRAMSESATAEPRRVGPVGLLRAMRDPDAQRALGFLSDFARQLGRQLRPESAVGPSAAAANAQQ